MMNLKATLHSIGFSLTATAMAACAAPAGDSYGDPAVAEAASDLSVASWSAPAFTMQAYHVDGVDRRERDREDHAATGGRAGGDRLQAGEHTRRPDRQASPRSA